VCGTIDLDAETVEATCRRCALDRLLFRADVGEVVVCPGEPADHVVVESWRPGRGLTRHRRW
jgi:hypothetical protein